MTIYIPMRAYCRHFRGATAGRTCEAFPDGIPMDIFKSKREHFDPYPGDRGVRLEPTADCPDYLKEANEMCSLLVRRHQRTSRTA